MCVDRITGKKDAVMQPNFAADPLTYLKVFVSFGDGAVYGGCCGCAYSVYGGPLDMFRLHRIWLHNLLDLVHEDLAVLFLPVSRGHVWMELNVDTDKLLLPRDHHKSSVFCLYNGPFPYIGCTKSLFLAKRY